MLIFSSTAWAEAGTGLIPAAVAPGYHGVSGREE
jgi:hypothetical protein